MKWNQKSGLPFTCPWLGLLQLKISDKWRNKNCTKTEWQATHGTDIGCDANNPSPHFKVEHENKTPPTRKKRNLHRNIDIGGRGSWHVIAVTCSSSCDVLLSGAIYVPPTVSTQVCNHSCYSLARSILIAVCILSHADQLCAHKPHACQHFWHLALPWLPRLHWANLAKLEQRAAWVNIKWRLWGSSPRPCGLAPEASALDHSAKLSCYPLQLWSLVIRHMLYATRMLLHHHHYQRWGFVGSFCCVRLPAHGSQWLPQCCCWSILRLSCLLACESCSLSLSLSLSFAVSKIYIYIYIYI